MSTVSQGIIVLLGPPTSPTGLEYTAITNTSATLYWLPPVIADCVVNYDVEIVRTDDNQLSSIANTLTNVTQYNITGLIQGQEYKYRVAAKDTNGDIGSYSTYSQPFTLDGKYYSVLQCLYVYVLLY